jgi:hypothetical protein
MLRLSKQSSGVAMALRRLKDTVCDQNQYNLGGNLDPFAI